MLYRVQCQTTQHVRCRVAELFCHPTMCSFVHRDRKNQWREDHYRCDQKLAEIHSLHRKIIRVSVERLYRPLSTTHNVNIALTQIEDGRRLDPSRSSIDQAIDAPANSLLDVIRIAHWQISAG